MRMMLFGKPCFLFIAGYLIRKRIHHIEPSTSTAKLRLRIVKADAIPTIRLFTAMEASP
jgi:hypothetical protein